jgi:hypothetical protein
MPRSIVRREMCFLVMNIGLSPVYLLVASVDSTGATRAMRKAALLATPEIIAEKR